MGDAGVFHPDDRLALLDGEIVEMAAIGSSHAACVNALNRVFSARFSDRAIVSVQNPVRLVPLSEPQPDVALLRRRPDLYVSRHPSPRDILLIVEVADTPAGFDRRGDRLALLSFPDEPLDAADLLP